MFAQLLITLTLVWILAEVLCRWILGMSVTAAARELLGLSDADEVEPQATATLPVVEPNASLRRLVGERRRELAETGSRLELAVEAAEVAEQLARREAELTAAEGRLAAVEGRRKVGSPS